MKIDKKEMIYRVIGYGIMCYGILSVVFTKAIGETQSTLDFIISTICVVTGYSINGVINYRKSHPDSIDKNK